MSALTLGIDPGVTGALALLDRSGQVELLADLPIIRDKSLAWVDGAELQSMLLNAIGGRQCHAVVERVSSMPGQGIASAFGFGVGFGSILSVLQTLRLPLELVTPSVWKRAVGLSSDKRASLDKARLLFPLADLTLAKHDGRAEALLLAYWIQSRRLAA
jgi:crossover junction endodeoxyribonuclease RuvC